MFARSWAFSSTVAPKPNEPVTVESTSHGPTTLLAIRWASTSTPRNGSPVTPSGWLGFVGYGPTSSLLIPIVGAGGAPALFPAQPSTAVEQDAASRATETNAK